MISVQYKGLQSAHQNLYAAVESRNQCTIMSFKYNATIGAAATANLFGSFKYSFTVSGKPPGD
jgi:hypothetical protein